MNVSTQCEVTKEIVSVVYNGRVIHVTEWRVSNSLVGIIATFTRRAVAERYARKHTKAHTTTEAQMQRSRLKT
jgi:hypothetical protein